ncbi:MAG: polyprenyl synthetase family protein [Verrucomicrobiota bacterium]|jgi:geranylgeranyl diphosphate synthase type I|nr:polyprenyl synthetase family protein [Verrucomicrobiota bacterium]
MEKQLLGIQDRITQCLSSTVLGRLGMDCRGLFASGKMLRARLLLRLAQARRASAAAWLPPACAVEMLHTASLLHDDVLDGGELRRHLPAFWTQYGVSASILAGDLIVGKAFALLLERGRARGDLLDLARYTTDVCEAEIEQEMLYRGKRPGAGICMALNRGKTGSLFAFSATRSAGRHPKQKAVLEDIGYDIGLCYQLADDYLDAHGSEKTAGKTLGRDAARRKRTSAGASDRPSSLAAFMAKTQRRSRKALQPWPELQQALAAYFEEDFNPVIAKLLGKAAGS